MRTHVAVDLTSLSCRLNNALGQNKFNGSVVKNGKFFTFSVPMHLLPSFSNTDAVNGSEVRKKIGNHVVHIHLNKKTDKYVIKSKHPEGLLGCINEGL